MLNASVDVQRVLGRLRRPQEDRRPRARTVQTRSLAAAIAVRRGIRSVVVASRLVPVRETSVIVDYPFITGRSTPDSYLTGEKVVEVLEKGLKRWGW